jgi:uncharacterized protein involved in response to NO
MNAPLLKMEEPRRPVVVPKGLFKPESPLWQLGFRPFYLLASLFAAFSILLWTAQVSGVLGVAYLAAPVWHAHEMLFGFGLAVLVGFLFTAGRNWSGEATPTGRLLMALAVLWLAGRLMVLTPWGWASAVVNASFAFSAAAGLAVPFLKAKNRRNYFFVALLVLLGCAELFVHAVWLGAVRASPLLGIQVALDVMLFIMVVMGGRVIPMFTSNGVPTSHVKRSEWADRFAHALALTVLLADMLQLDGFPLVVVLSACAIVQCVRLLLWDSASAFRTPLVWILHAGYFWIVIHLGLRVCALLELVPLSAATHALTIGAMASMMMGMMTRTARGHTARPLKADRWEVSAYSLVLAAAVVRVFVPLALPAYALHAIECAGLMWVAAFSIYAWRYWPILTSPRLDGRPG